MAVTRIAAASAGGTHVASTAAINTTGATLIVISVTVDDGVPDAIPLTDNQGNTYTALTLENGASPPTFKTRLYYKLAPTVAASHTFTVTEDISYCGLSVAAFGGETLAFEQEAAGAVSSSASTIQPGSVTPGSDGALVITGLGRTTNGPDNTINSGFTVDSQIASSGGSYEGSGIASLIQTTAAAVNPTWTLDSAVPCIAVGAVFTVVGGAASPALIVIRRA